MITPYVLKNTPTALACYATTNARKVKHTFLVCRIFVERNLMRERPIIEGLVSLLAVRPTKSNTVRYATTNRPKAFTKHLPAVAS